MPTRRSTRRFRWWWLTVGTFLPVGLGGCIGTLQNEIEVLFATEVIQNALLVPQSILYNLFGDFFFKIVTQL